jgi:hypothetical protein
MCILKDDEEETWTALCPYCHEPIKEAVMSHCDHCDEFEKWLPEPERKI